MLQRFPEPHNWFPSRMICAKTHNSTGFCHVVAITTNCLLFPFMRKKFSYGYYSWKKKKNFRLSFFVEYFKVKYVRRHVPTLCFLPHAPLVSFESYRFFKEATFLSSTYKVFYSFQNQLDHYRVYFRPSHFLTPLKSSRHPISLSNIRHYFSTFFHIQVFLIKFYMHFLFLIISYPTLFRQF